MAGEELFIYYRAAAAQAEPLAAAVQRLQAGLSAGHAGLAARLLRRAGTPEGEDTWMEIYALPTGSDTDALLAEIERAARVLAPWLAGPRHVERFTPCAS